MLQTCYEIGNIINNLREEDCQGNYQLQDLKNKFSQKNFTDIQIQEDVRRITHENRNKGIIVVDLNSNSKDVHVNLESFSEKTLLDSIYLVNRKLKPDGGGVLVISKSLTKNKEKVSKSISKMFESGAFKYACSESLKNIDFNAEEIADKIFNSTEELPSYYCIVFRIDSKYLTQIINKDSLRNKILEDRYRNSNKQKSHIDTINSKKCHYCYQNKDKIYDKTPYSFASVYAINFGVSDGIGCVFTCEDCLKKILIGKQLVETYCKVKISSMTAYILPKNVNLEILDSFIFSNLSKCFDTVKKPNKTVGTGKPFVSFQKLLSNISSNEEDIITDILDNNFSMIKFIFAKKDKQDLKIYDTVNSVYPSRIKLIADELKAHDLKLFHILKLLGNKYSNTNPFYKKESEILKKIVLSRKIDKDYIFRCIYQEYYFNFFNNKKYVDKNIKNSFKVFNFLCKIDTIKDSYIFPIGENQMSEEENNEQQEKKEPKNANEIAEKIQNKIKDSSYRELRTSSQKSWFLLGKFYGYVTSKQKQYYQKSNNKSTDLYRNIPLALEGNMDKMHFCKIFESLCRKSISYGGGFENDQYIKIINEHLSVIEKINNYEAKTLFISGTIYRKEQNSEDKTE